jgi:ribonucleoside-diphosphate reductase beta chain
MSLLQTRTTYKPIHYPWALDYWRKQQQIHWLSNEVDMSEDVRDWNLKLTDGERNLLTQLFRFFTQGDIDVADGYFSRFIPVLGGQPEIKMMMGAFANMETVHIEAYAKLLETVGLPDSEYEAFYDFKEMAAKHDYVGRFVPVQPGANGEMSDDDLRTLIKTVAVYSAFTEGLQLFSSFAILLNFARFGKMKGMCKIVEWSIRDESLHCEGMCQVARTLIEENIHVWTDDFKAELYQIAREMVSLEDSFIDLCWREAGEIEGLSPDEVKRYIRYMADRRLNMLGLKSNYGAEGQNLNWIDWMIGDGHTNFFEARETEYAKGTIQGSWDDAWAA